MVDKAHPLGGVFEAVLEDDGALQIYLIKALLCQVSIQGTNEEFTLTLSCLIFCARIIIKVYYLCHESFGSPFLQFFIFFVEIFCHVI